MPLTSLRHALLFLLLGGCAASPSAPPVCLGADLTPDPGEHVFTDACGGLQNIAETAWYGMDCGATPPTFRSICPYVGLEVPQHVRDACGEYIRTATDCDEISSLLANCYCEG